MKNNSIGRVIYDYNLKNGPKRVGRRIRKIRRARGLTQPQLGESVGLNADRIQKYENGSRKPKADLLEKIANTLDVEIQALSDPDTSTFIGAMYAFFEMEELFGLDIKRKGDDLVLTFEDGATSELSEHLSLWEKKKRWVEADLENASSEEEKNQILKEYDMWKWNYPPESELPLKE